MVKISVLFNLLQGDSGGGGGGGGGYKKKHTKIFMYSIFLFFSFTDHKLNSIQETQPSCNHN